MWDLGLGSFLLLLPMDIQLLQQGICWKCSLFSIELFLHLCQKSVEQKWVNEKSIGHICVGLYLGFLFFSIRLCVYTSTKTRILITVVSLEIKQADLFHFILFQNCFSHLVPLSSHINSRIILSVSIQISYWDFDRNYVIPIHQFGEIWHLYHVKPSRSDHRITSLHFFLILFSLISIVWFSAYKFCTFLLDLYLSNLIFERDCKWHCILNFHVHMEYFFLYF